MIALAGLLWLPSPLVGGIGIAMIMGHNLRSPYLYGLL